MTNQAKCVQCENEFATVTLFSSETPSLCPSCFKKSRKRFHKKREVAEIKSGELSADAVQSVTALSKEAKKALLGATDDDEKKQSQSNLERLRAAVRLTKDGFAVIPVKKDKKPCLKSWGEYQTRKPDMLLVQDWWSRYPDANIAVVLSPGHVVLDIDDPKLAEAILASTDILERTTVERSVRGGLHIWFHEAEPKTQTENLRHSKEIAGELRCHGTYLIVPPSEGYRYLSERPILEVEDAKAEALKLLGSVGALHEGVEVETSGVTTPEPIAESILPAGISIGARNETLTRVAGFLFGRGMSFEVALAILFHLNKTFCNPPLEDRDIKTIAWSVNKAENDSHTVSPPVVREKKWRPLSEIAGAGAPDREWVWEGYLTRGCTTLLSGHPKAGKTTLLFSLIQAFRSGGMFLDRSASCKGKVLIVTEESQLMYKDKADEEKFSDPDVLILSAYDMYDWTQEEVMNHIKQAVREEGVGLVAIDTLSEFWGVTEENAAASVQKAVKPFKLIAHELNVAMLLIHHLRKTEGEYGVAHRGSGALLGAVDIGLEFHYANSQTPNRRRIISKSRFSKTPKDLLIERVKDEGYKCLGDPAQLSKDDAKKRLLEIVGEEPMSIEDIRDDYDEPKPGKSNVRDLANQCFREGLLERLGKGVRNDQYLYKKPSPTKES